MNDFNALFYRILRGLSTADDATIGNVFSCLASADACNKRQSAEYRVYARYHLNRAAQHLWGSLPPYPVQVNDKWEYSVKL